MVNDISRSRAGVIPWIIKTEDLQSIPFSEMKACACSLSSGQREKQKCAPAQFYTIRKRAFSCKLGWNTELLGLGSYIGEQRSKGKRVIVKLLKGVSGFTGSQVKLEERASGEKVLGREQCGFQT